MHLQSLQKNIEDFEEVVDRLTKSNFGLEDLVRFMETENELHNLTELLRNNIRLGDDEGLNPAGLRSDAARKRFFDKVMKALGEMMESYSSQDQDDKLEQEVKRSEQALGITIAAASTSGVTFKKEEGSEALAGASISGVTFKKEEDGEASDLEEQKMRSKFEGLKKERDSGKKSLMEYIKKCNESDKEPGVMNALKVQAVKVGIELSRLIIDFVFMMLEQEQWAEKIGLFKSSLKGCCIEDENSMVIKKILNLLEMAKIDEPIKGKWAGIEQTDLDECNQKESLNRKSHIDDLYDEFLDQALGLFSHQFIELVLNLESFMSHPLLPKSEDLMNVVLTEFKCRLKQSEEKLKGIGEDVNKLKAMLSSKVDRKDEKMTEARIFVESMIAELWNQSESS